MHPVLFTFGIPFTEETRQVSTYAALMFFGAALAILLSVGLARRRGIPGFDVFAAGIIAFGVGFLGARLAFILLNGKPEGLSWAVFLGHSGGLVWYGGFIGGAVGGLFYLKGYRIPILPVLEVVAPGLALGHLFGRLGCFTAGCCYGRVAFDSPLAVRFPVGALAPAHLPLHPVQLYEAAGLLLLFGILLAWHFFGGRRRDGVALAIYVGGYASLRLVTESFRADDRGGTLIGLSPGQWTSIFLITLLAVAFIWLRKSAGEENDLVKATKEETRRAAD